MKTDLRRTDINKTCQSFKEESEKKRDSRSVFCLLLSSLQRLFSKKAQNLQDSDA